MMFQEPFFPLTDYETAGSTEDLRKGLFEVHAGRVGCLVVAGGQGTRLNYNHPKGTFPVGPHQESLFQLICQRTQEIQEPAGVLLSLAIMTSRENDAETRQYFEEHDFFGLQPEQIDFFVQGEQPLSYPDGKPVVDSSGNMIMAANGNGSALRKFHESGLLEKWKKKGIRMVNFILVDNPLADPWDGELIGYHLRKGGDAVIKCIEKTDPEELLGMIVKVDGRVRVIEYTEFPEAEKKAVDENHHLKYRCANISLFSFSMDFIETIADVRLPLHRAVKVMKSLPDAPTVIKEETFIFDVLPYARQVDVLMCPREECFAPLKNASGKDSPETVRQALLAKRNQRYNGVSL